MKKRQKLILLFSFLTFGLQAQNINDETGLRLTSPDGKCVFETYRM